MAHHQHALVRYVTLDRCLSRFRMGKEELIARCSEAVERVTGNDRGVSERTFFNDLQAMREGIVLNRKAPIQCLDGQYRYTEPGFTLFPAGDEQVSELQRRLWRLEERARLALRMLAEEGVGAEVLKQLQAMLFEEEGLAPMLHLEALAKDATYVKEQASVVKQASVKHSVSSRVLSSFWEKVMDESSNLPLDEDIATPAPRPERPASSPPPAPTPPPPPVLPATPAPPPPPEVHASEVFSIEEPGPMLDRDPRTLLRRIWWILHTSEPRPMNTLRMAPRLGDAFEAMGL